MFAFDTNYLIRHLVQDHPKQSRVVREAIKSEVDSGHSILIPDIVLCETLWVLKRAYGASRADMVQTLKALADDLAFTFEDSPRIRRATESFESGKADYADYLIVEISRANKRQLLTFDPTFKKEIS